MFGARFDDSGTHSGSECVAVGGFVADVEQLAHLEREWAELLSEFELVPNPGYFHMAEFESRVGPYAWEDGRRTEFVQRMTGIIGGRASALIAASFPTRNFESLKGNLKGIDFPRGYQYSACVQVCWSHIGSWAAENHLDEGDIETVLEDGTCGKGLVIESHRYLSNPPGDNAKRIRLGPVTFATKRESQALQAADFIAYEVYKRTLENIRNGKRRRRSIEAIASSLPIYATFLGDERTQEIIDSRSDLNGRQEPSAFKG